MEQRQRGAPRVCEGRGRTGSKQLLGRSPAQTHLKKGTEVHPVSSPCCQELLLMPAAQERAALVPQPRHGQTAQGWSTFVTKQGKFMASIR